MDNCCREYLFISDFFMVSGTGAQNLFENIMGKTLTMFMVGINLFESIISKILTMFMITRRFAEFSAAIVGINASYPRELVRRSFGQLQAEVENFILKMAAEFSHHKDQLIFLINNYDMMLNVLVERTTRDSKEAEMFCDLLAARTQEFVEEILAPHFGGLISWVKDSEVALEHGLRRSFITLISEEKRVQQIVRGFNNDWKRVLESINQEVMRAFTKFKNGTQIFQGTLTLLIQYNQYHRFQKVLAQPMFRHLQIRH
ncbi:vacuolar protein sorting-associated protein 52-like protein [Plakobranchus ocellatus]|uniref:Vacuolar protein sorting-associated protein 52-like protein n=1 Tax=Plakobranchus ocellatus TaxID=259542 RepID=A0AAV4BFJ2_9GAST|nr:vacuolar protein sorting-associated protein 52-like protein [Plakobranchus ocellatus]